MFTYLKNKDENLYNATEILREIFNSGNNLPYYNQMRIIFEGVINFIERKFNIILKEKMLGQKVNNPSISFYLYLVIRLNKNDVDEFLTVTNDQSHYNPKKTEISKMWNKKRLVQFLYNSIKLTFEKIENCKSIPDFDDDKYNKFIENNEIIKEQIVENKKELEELKKNKKEITNDIITSKNKLEELNEQYKKRQTEILLSESNKENNELYQLGMKLINEMDYEAGFKVFTSMKISNIMDLRSYVGIFLCKFECRTIYELIDKCSENKIYLNNDSLFEDCMKFLKDKDKNFIINIADKIRKEIIYQEILKQLKNKKIIEALIKMESFKSELIEYNLESFKQYIINEVFYLTAIANLKEKKFDESIKVLKRILFYKDSSSLFNFALEEKERFNREEEERKIQEKIAFEQEVERKRKAHELQIKLELERKKREEEKKRSYYKIKANMHLDNGEYKKAIEYYKLAKANEKDIRFVESTYLVFDEILRQYVNLQLTRDNIEEKVNSLIFSMKNKYNNIQEVYEYVKSFYPSFNEIEKYRIINNNLNDEKAINIISAYQMYLSCKNSEYSKKYYCKIIDKIKHISENNISFEFIKQVYEIQWDDAKNIIIDIIYKKHEHFKQDFILKYCNFIIAYKNKDSLNDLEKNIINKYNERIRKKTIQYILDEDYKKCLNYLCKSLLSGDEKITNANWDYEWQKDINFYDYYIKAKILCFWNLNLDSDIVILYESYKDLIDLFFEKYLNDEDYYIIIERFRGTKIEKNIINKIIDNKNDYFDDLNIFYIDLNYIQVAPFYIKNDNLRKSLIEEINGFYEKYSDYKKNIINKVKNKFLLNVLILSCMIIICFIYYIFMITKNNSILFKDDNLRLIGIVCTCLLSIVIYVLTYQNIKGLINLNKDKKYYTKDLEKSNVDYVNEVNENKKIVYLSLIYGFEYEIPSLTNSVKYEETKENKIIVSKWKIIYYSILVLIQCLFIFTQNSYIYNKVENNIRYFDVDSNYLLKWSFSNLPNNYKNLSKIKEDYYILNKYIDKLDRYAGTYCTEGFAREGLLGVQKKVEYTIPKYSKEVIENYWFLQEKNVKESINWNFSPYLKNINLMFMVEGIRMYTSDRKEYFLVDYKDFYYVAPGNIQDGLCYAFNNGKFVAYSYEKGNSSIATYSWVWIYSLSNFEMTSKYSASITLKINDLKGNNNLIYKLYIDYEK